MKNLPTELETMLQEAKPYCAYGPNYNRHIATTFDTINRAIESGWTVEQLKPFFEELKMRLDRWATNSQA